MEYDYLELGVSNFWEQVEKKKKKGNYSFLKDCELFYVVFDDTVKMQPFVRKTEIMFAQAAAQESKENGFVAVINAQVYGMTKAGYLDYSIGSDPVDPEYIYPEGSVIYGKKLISGRPANLNFYVANNMGNPQKYKFGFGAAPLHSDAAIGGAGPLIINGLPYGEQNRYISGKPKGKLIGEPKPENKKNLAQRSNATFTAFMAHDAAPKTGITVVAYSSKKKKVAVMVKEDGSGNIMLSALRNKLIKSGFDNAVFLDGSNSSMLMVNNVFYARQAKSKNMTNNVGIGFKY